MGRFYDHLTGLPEDNTAPTGQLVNQSHLLHCELGIAAVPVLLYPIEDEVGPGVEVQLPGLLLQVLDGQLEAGKPGGEASLAIGCLLLGLRQTEADIVEIPHYVRQSLRDSLLEIEIRLQLSS